jgi:hypothetical protein
MVSMPWHRRTKEPVIVGTTSKEVIVLLGSKSGRLISMKPGECSSSLLVETKGFFRHEACRRKTPKSLKLFFSLKEVAVEKVVVYSYKE